MHGSCAPLLGIKFFVGVSVKVIILPFIVLLFSNTTHMETEDIVLIKKITAIAKINQEIIDRIPWKDVGKKPTYTVQSNQQEGLLTKIKLVRSASTAVDLVQLCQPIQIQAIEDYFNDKLDYNVRNISDITRLNGSMLPVAHKYELFGPTPKALRVLRQFKENYEAIQIALGKIEEVFYERNDSEKVLNAKVDQLNARADQIRQLAKELERDVKLLQQEVSDHGKPLQKNLKVSSLFDEEEEGW